LIELNSSYYSQNKINPADPHFISNRNQNKDDKGALNKSNYSNNKSTFSNNYKQVQSYTEQRLEVMDISAISHASRRSKSWQVLDKFAYQPVETSFNRDLLQIGKKGND
jgi:hypothetical protein